jgi:hypothetical protein
MLQGCAHFSRQLPFLCCTLGYMVKAHKLDVACVAVDIAVRPEVSKLSGSCLAVTPPAELIEVMVGSCI